MEKSEKNPPSRKRVFLGAIIFFCVLFIVVAAVKSTSSADGEDSNKNPKEEPKAETSEEEVEEGEPDDSAAQAESGSDSVVEYLKDNKLVDAVEFEDGTLLVAKELTSIVSETSVLKHKIYDYFELVNEVFKSDEVNVVRVILATSMVDEKGNEEMEPVVEFAYTRDDFEELSYENFLEMSYSQTWRILNESSYYSIHPGFYKKVDEDYTENLKNGLSK